MHASGEWLDPEALNVPEEYRAEVLSMRKACLVKLSSECLCKTCYKEWCQFIPIYRIQYICDPDAFVHCFDR